MINIALPKGRLGEKVYKIFDSIGYGSSDYDKKSRKLVFENLSKGIRFFWVKPSDVCIYVERGVADIGVCGKDILLENDADIYELFDLNIGNCQMAVAAKENFVDDGSKTLKVATKFPQIASRFFALKGRDIEIIKLNGSIELAPILGLSDVIVDIVETGETLRENNLKVFDSIVSISARLIANKTSFKFKTDEIEMILNLFKEKGRKDD